MQGFRSWNNLKKELKELNQIYTLTSDLYFKEHIRIGIEVPKQIDRQNTSVHIGSVIYSLEKLYTFTNWRYPERLRHFLIITLVTLIETFVVEISREVSKRDLEPFKTKHTNQYSKEQILSTTSIDSLIEEIINQELRGISTGSPTDINKFFLAHFDIDLNNIPINRDLLEMVFATRHVLVHRNGIIDNLFYNEFSKQFPKICTRIGGRISIPHNFFMDALNLVEEYGDNIQQLLSAKYNIDKRKKYITNGQVRKIQGIEESTYFVELETVNSKYNPVVEIPKIILSDKDGDETVDNYLYKIIKKENRSYLFLVCDELIFKKIMGSLKEISDISTKIITKLI